MKPGAFGKYAVDYEMRVDYERLRRERTERARAEINSAGLGALLTWDECSIRYLTSYYVTTPMRASEMQMAFLARNGDPHLFGGGTPSETERRMPWLSERVHPSLGMPRVTAQDANDLMIGRIADAIAEMMAKYGVEREPLGIEGSTLSMLFLEAFKQRGIEVVHGKPVMDEARMIKTQDEIELMRITCANSERAFADIADAIRPGIRECDLVGIGIKALYQEGDDHTEDLVCCSGYNTNPYGWSFTDKPIRPGDLIYIDVDGASYQGYKSCVYRTFSCGKASQHQKDLYEECRAMLYAGMDAVKDGATDFDITDKWPQSPQYWGYDNWGDVTPYACGHGLGLTLHDRPLITIVKKIAGYEPTKLRTGMVLALETYTGQKGGSDGVRLEENVLVTEDGYELLTRWPVDELMECWLPYR